MKKLLFILTFFLLTACTHIGHKEDVKGEVDVKGVISKIDNNGKRVLVDDKKTGLIWVTLNENDNIKKYEEGQEIVVWIDGGIRESYPAQAKALHIEIPK
ncbi:DUF3221 domain-containing protein [Bacillus sp. AFS055030]|uniref:DUF3221 domain-containing protein n=1 Tax=Bacillus sp. AFS055030 TaxID=2033507 RepID=UPI000BFE8DFF|nr:DUF3221 domain-containing protein [Bacillus sp. AFS055030]PGL69423.1 DUF3221 domain-containing protein [Bacillus sp. AFS055030]